MSRFVVLTVEFVGHISSSSFANVALRVASCVG